MTNQRINLTNLNSAMKITVHYNTLHYTTLHYAIYITIHYIGVIQKHVTALIGRCAKFGKLIRKKKYGGGGVGCVREISFKGWGEKINVRYVLYMIPFNFTKYKTVV